MASGEQDILREYLISLGFKVNEAAEKKFDGNLTRMDKSATKLGKSLVGVALAAGVMATEFAFRMEKLYYSSRLAESSAANLSSLDFAGKQTGIQNMTANVQSLARALRANPGLQGLLNSLGVKVEGRDRADVLTDMVGALKKMPFYIAEKYAAMFGISADDLLLMEEGLDKMKEAQALRKQAAQEMGVDVNKAAEVGLEYARQWREVLMYVGLFRDAVSVQLLPAMRELAGVTKQVMVDWVKIIQTPREKLIADLRVAAGLDDPGGGVVLDPAVRRNQKLAAEGKPPLTPAEEKIERELPYHAPEGNKGLGVATEDWLRERAYKGARQRGELPPDPRARQPGTMTREEAGETKGDKTQASADSLMGRWQRWRENRDRKKQGLPPLPDKAEADSAPAQPKEAPTPAPTKQDALARLKEELAAAQQRGDTAASAGLAAEITKMGGEAPDLGGGRATKRSFLEALEQKYALPKGVLDRVWKQESGRGQHMLSPSGAEGHFGFMPETGKQYGLKDSGDANDFWKSATAASKYWSDLMQKYGQDARYAAAAYNWGPGNVDKALTKAMKQHGDWSPEQIDQHVLGNVPEETRKYINSVVGNREDGNPAGDVTIHAPTRIDVHGNQDPEATAEAVAEKQRQVWSDVVRQQRQIVR